MHQVLEAALGGAELSWFDEQDLFDQIRICDLGKRPGYTFARAVREIYRESAQITPPVTQQRLGKVLMFKRDVKKEQGQSPASAGG